MRAKLVMFAISLVAIAALALQALPQAVAQNANKPAPRRPRAAANKNTSAAAAAPSTAAAPTMTPAAKPAKKRVRRAKKQMAMKGVPSGVANCLKHLSEMASKDPLIAYEGHPEEIVVNGLLWNDPKSKCSIGSDESMRKKIADLAMKWRMKDAAGVRSILQELEGMAPK